MNAAELLRWQWNGYSGYHKARTNLLLHIVLVPLFLAGNVGLIFSVIRPSLVLGLISLSTMVLSIAFQGRAHRQEALPPEPFTSPVNAISRILLEQWITFPRFVVSGGWYQALRQLPSP